ncbi:HAMP domain-containing sensor histidine kinase [Massilia sp.]|uniref:sensor histidine kinase n=1 Tax=Massilia sp. TaxID=1882437 RepID=UPI00289F6BD9|nr:HAMP domain-containing sensor histidine kinase [Massilia sp.]
MNKAAVESAWMPWRGGSLQRKIGMLFVLFGLLLALGLSIQGNLSQQLVVHPIWEELLRSSTAQYLADQRLVDDKALPAQGLLRGWRVRDGAAPPGMPAYFAQLAPGYHDEQAMDAYDNDRSHSVLVTPLADGERIVMAVDITDLENDQNMMGFISVLVALVSGLTIIASLLWLYRGMRRPVRLLALRMDRLDPEQPSQRLATDFDLSELHDIAVLVNRHLERVERFIERERSLLDQASHEFRTPIAVIAGAVDVLKLYDLPPAAAAPLQRIQSTTDGLLETMAALLFLSREGDAGTPLESTRLDALLTQLVDDHCHLLDGKDARFEIGELQPLWVACPEAILRIVVGNLLRNAAENTWQGAIRIRLADGRLAIEDSGAGFDTVAAARRYTRALRDSAKQGGGQGLGLFLTRRVCERFGWTLSMSSHPGQGTLAELRFPD